MEKDGLPQVIPGIPYVGTPSKSNYYEWAYSKGWIPYEMGEVRPADGTIDGEHVQLPAYRRRLGRGNPLFLLRSEDGGVSWTDPALLFTGHYWNCPTGMVMRDGRIYWALCELVVASRTSSGADGMHSADYATFHRVADFRRLALPGLTATRDR